MAFHYKDICKFLETSRIPLDFSQTAFRNAQGSFDQIVKEVEAALLRVDSRCDFPIRIEGFHYAPLFNILAETLENTLLSYQRLFSQPSVDSQAVRKLEDQAEQLIQLLYRIYCTVWKFEGVKTHTLFPFLLRYCGNVNVIELLFDMTYYLFLARDWKKADLRVAKYFLAYGTAFIKLLGSFNWDYERLDRYIKETLPNLSAQGKVDLFKIFTKDPEEMVKVIEEATDGSLFIPEMVLAKLKPELSENSAGEEKCIKYYEMLGQVSLGLLLLKEERVPQRQFYSMLSTANSLTNLLVRLPENRKFGLLMSIEHLDFYLSVPAILNGSYLRVLMQEFEAVKPYIENKNLENQQIRAQMRRFYRLIDGISNNSLILAAVFTEKAFADFKTFTDLYLCEQDGAEHSYFFQILLFLMKEYENLPKDPYYENTQSIRILNHQFRDTLIETLNSLFIGFTELLNRFLEKGKTNRLGLIELPINLAKPFRKTMDYLTAIIVKKDLLQEDHSEPLFVIFRFLNPKIQGLHYYCQDLYNKFEEMVSAPFEGSFQKLLDGPEEEGNGKTILSEEEEESKRRRRRGIVKKYVNTIHRMHEQITKICRLGQWENSPYGILFDKMITSKLWTTIIERVYEQQQWDAGWSEENLEAAKESGFRWCYLLMILQRNAPEGGVQFFVEETVKKMAVVLLKLTEGNKEKTLSGFYFLLETFERLDYEESFVAIAKDLGVYIYTECLTDVSALDESMNAVQVDMLGNEMVTLFTLNPQFVKMNDPLAPPAVKTNEMWTQTWLKKLNVSLQKAEEYLDNELSKLNEYLINLRNQEGEEEANSMKTTEKSSEAKDPNSLFKPEIIGIKAYETKDADFLLKRKVQKLEEYFVILMFSKLGFLNQILEMTTGCLVFNQTEVDPETLESIKEILKKRWINYCWIYFRRNYMYIFWDFYSDCFIRIGKKSEDNKFYSIIHKAYQTLMEEALSRNTEGILNCLKSLSAGEIEKVLCSKEKLVINDFGGFRTRVFTSLFQIKTAEVLSELFLNSRWYNQTQDLPIHENLESIFEQAFMLYNLCLKGKQPRKEWQTADGKEFWSEYDPVFTPFLRNGIVDAVLSNEDWTQVFLRAITKVFNENMENKEAEDRLRTQTFTVKWVLNILKASLGKRHQGTMLQFFLEKKKEGDSEDTYYQRLIEWVKSLLLEYGKTDDDENLTKTILRVLETLDSYFFQIVKDGFKNVAAESLQTSQTNHFYNKFLLEFVYSVSEQTPGSKKITDEIIAYCAEIYIKLLKQLVSGGESESESKGGAPEDFLNNIKASFKGSIAKFKQSTAFYDKIYRTGDLYQIFEILGFSHYLRDIFPFVLVKRACNIFNVPLEDQFVKEEVDQWKMESAESGVMNGASNTGTKIALLFKIQSLCDHFLKENRKALTDGNPLPEEGVQALEKVQEIGLTYWADLQKSEIEGLNEEEFSIYLKLIPLMIYSKSVETMQNVVRKPIEQLVWRSMKNHVDIFLACYVSGKQKAMSSREEVSGAIFKFYLPILKGVSNNPDHYAEFVKDEKLIWSLVKLATLTQERKYLLQTLVSLFVLNECDMYEWNSKALAMFGDLDKKTRLGNGGMRAVKIPSLLGYDEKLKGIMENLFLEFHTGKPASQGESKFIWTEKAINPSVFLLKPTTVAFEQILTILVEQYLADQKRKFDFMTRKEVTTTDESSFEILTRLLGTFPFLSLLLSQLRFDTTKYGFPEFFSLSKELTFYEIMIHLGSLLNVHETKTLMNLLCEQVTPFVDLATLRSQTMEIESTPQVKEADTQLELNHWVVNGILQKLSNHMRETIEKKESLKWEFMECWKWTCWTQGLVKPIGRGQVEILSDLGEELMNQCLYFTGKFIGSSQDLYLKGFQEFQWETFFLIVKDRVLKWASSFGVDKKFNTKSQFLYYLIISLCKKQKRKGLEKNGTKKEMSREDRLKVLDPFEDIRKQQEREVPKAQELDKVNINKFPELLRLLSASKEQHDYDKLSFLETVAELKILANFFTANESESSSLVDVGFWNRRFSQLTEVENILIDQAMKNVAKENLGTREQFTESLAAAEPPKQQQQQQQPKVVFADPAKNSQEKQQISLSYDDDSLTKFLRDLIAEDMNNTEEDSERKEAEKIKKFIDKNGATLKMALVQRLESISLAFTSEIDRANEKNKCIKWYQSLTAIQKKALICLDSTGHLKEILSEAEFIESREFKNRYERIIQKGGRKKEPVETRNVNTQQSREEDSDEGNSRESEEDYVSVEELDGVEIQFPDINEEAERADLVEFDYDTCRSFQTDSEISTEDIQDILNENEEEVETFMDEKKRDMVACQQSIELPRLQKEVMVRILEFWGKAFPFWDLLNSRGDVPLVLDSFVYLKILACREENERMILGMLMTILTRKEEELKLSFEGKEGYERLIAGVVTFLNVYFRDFPGSLRFVPREEDLGVDVLLKEKDRVEEEQKEGGLVICILEKLCEQEKKVNGNVSKAIFKKLVDLFVVVMRGLGQENVAYEVPEGSDLSLRVIRLMESWRFEKNRKLLGRFCVGLKSFIKARKVAGAEEALFEILNKIVKENIDLFLERAKKIKQFEKLEEVSTSTYEDLQKLLDMGMMNLTEILSVIETYLDGRENKQFVSRVLQLLRSSGVVQAVCNIANLWGYLREKNSKGWFLVREGMLRYFEVVLCVSDLEKRFDGEKKKEKENGEAEKEEEKKETAFGDLLVVSRQVSRTSNLDRVEAAIIENKDSVSIVIDHDPKKILHNEHFLKILGSFPGLIDMDRKRMILMEYLSQNLKERSPNSDLGFTKVRVRRDRILEDTMSELSYISSEDLLTWNFSIIFEKEAGIDAGGLTSEWVSLVVKELFNPEQGLFKLSYNQICLYPNPNSNTIPNHLAYFRLAGQMIALSIREGVLCRIPLTVGFLKQILGRKVDLNDLEEIDPQLMKSLKHLLQFSAEEIADLEQNFTYEEEYIDIKTRKELVTNGDNIELTEANKEEYVQKVVQEILVDSIAEQVKQFNKGFFEILPPGAIKMLLPNELELFVCGRSEIGLDDLKSFVRYSGYTQKDNVIQWFWEIIEEYTDKERMSFLFFVTGSSALPPKGLGEIKITIKKQHGSTFNLPVAHTCFNELELPDYDSKDTLRQKLLIAISEGKEGFHIV